MSTEQLLIRYKKNISIRLFITTIFMILDTIFGMKYSIDLFRNVWHIITGSGDLPIKYFIEHQNILFWISFMSILLSAIIGVILMVTSIIDNTNMLAKESEVDSVKLEKYLNDTLLVIVLSDLMIVISIVTWICISPAITSIF